MFRDELDMLECRLTELEDSPVYRHVLIEAPVDHQGHPKPLHYAGNRERFAPWADRITHVVARGLTGAPWDREHAQREAVRLGLEDAGPDDVILHGDVDEIPSAAALKAGPGWAFEQRLHAFAADWVHPQTWRGTVSRRYGDVATFTALRDERWTLPLLPDGGWHLTWLGGPAEISRKLTAFCHLELRDEIAAANARGELYEGGLVPGTWGHEPYSPMWFQQKPADIDETWPRYIRERRCPQSWLRPRH